MGSLLDTVRDSYDHVWRTTSFSNVYHVSSLVEQLSDDEFAAFCQGSLSNGRKKNLVSLAAANDRFFPHHCATCAPFAILVVDEVLTRLPSEANVDAIFLHTDSHGAAVLIDTDGSHYLIDSSLGTAHMLEEDKWFYKTDRKQNAIVASSPPPLPYAISELVQCMSLRRPNPHGDEYEVALFCEKVLDAVKFQGSFTGKALGMVPPPHDENTFNCLSWAYSIASKSAECLRTLSESRFENCRGGSPIQGETDSGKPL